MVCLHLQVSESTALMFQELEGKEDERGVARQTMIDYAKAAMEDQGGEVDNLKDITKADLFKATEDVGLEWVIFTRRAAHCLQVEGHQEGCGG